MSKPQPEWISVPEACEILGVSDVWVLKLIHANELEGFKLSGRAWAVSRKSVEKNAAEYAKQNRRTGRPRSRAG